MPFPRKLLAEHENIILDLRPHWVAIVLPIFWGVLIVAAAAFGYAKLDDPSWIRPAILIAAAVALLVFTVAPIIRWIFTLFVLTTDRLITRRGVIAKSSKEIPLENINDITFSQGILERMVGAGDLLVESAGERGQERITNVRRPEAVQLQIYKAAEENSNRMHRGGAPAAAPPEDKSIPAQIEALARLKEQGVISETEFESKKQELLKRL